MDISPPSFHRPQTLVNREYGAGFWQRIVRGLGCALLCVSVMAPTQLVASPKVGRTTTASGKAGKPVVAKRAAAKTTATKSGAKSPKVTTIAKSKAGAKASKAIAKGKRDRGKKRGVPALLSQPRRMPLQSHVPETVVSLLEDGEIAPAVRRLYLEPASVKNMMLIREMERIGEVESGVKPAQGDAHRHYLNLAVAYHNLHLFLKTQGKRNRALIGKAQSAYVRAEKTARGPHKFEAECLRAALEASLGNTKVATKLISKIPTTHLEQDLSGVTALASYYAAIGDTAKTVALLGQAQTLGGGEQLATWAQVGDDFAELRATPEFQQYLTSLGERAQRARNTPPVARSRKSKRR